MAWTFELLVSFALCSTIGSSVSGPDTIETDIDAQAFANRILLTTDLVLDRHIDPPTRQGMVLAVAKALATRAEQPVPAGLSRRISEMSGQGELASLLAELWMNASKSASVPAQELQDAALEGLCNVVPGEPRIICAKDLKVELQFNANRYVGIGIQLSLDEQSKRPVISVPFARGPAHLAGAKAGDRILQIDGTSTENMSLQKTVELLRGPEGTPVTIVVQQPDAPAARRLEITRNVVPLESVLGYRRTSENTWDYRPVASEPIAYVCIPRVLASTLHELRQVAQSLEDQDIRALVIDLRNVPGGELQHFLRIADALLGETVLGRSRDVRGTVAEYRSGPDSLFPRWPLVLLVNRTTASAAEFLAAALQDSQRAVVVGEPTAGACHINQLLDLPDGLGAIVLRTGTLERADGRSLNNPESAEASLRAMPPRAGGRPMPANPGHPTAANPRKEGAAARNGSADHGGGVQPDHVVEMDEQNWAVWLRWRHLQDIPDPAPDAVIQAPNDLPLEKAVELLRATLKEESARKT